jgi:tetratricopeptide (TPR) repeat protein
MCRTAGLIVVGLVAGSTAVAADGYRQRFEALETKKDNTAAEKLLAEWLAKAPGDPAAYVAGANHYFNRSRDVPLVISTAPAGEGGLTLKSDATGKNAGSINPGEPDKALAARAVDLLRQATTRFPDRLDIWFGLAYLQQESRDWDGEVATLRAAVAAAVARPAAMRWEDGAPLPEPAERFIPRSLHEYARFHLERGNAAEPMARATAIATLASESYPRHPYAFNTLAAIHYAHGDSRGALDYLQKAHDLAPDDMLVLFNLARTAGELGDTKRAQEGFEAVVAKSKDREIVRDARAELKKLRAKKRGGP